MTNKIKQQEEDIKKQITIYAEQTEIKKTEEKELLKVLNEYKSKYDEFAKAMKKSKDTFKMYEQEIKNMNQKVLELQKMKKDLMSGVSGGSKKNKKNKNKDENMIEYSAEQFNQKGEKTLEEWTVEKANLMKEKEELMK